MTQRAPKRARQRAAGRPGPLPMILNGFDRTTLDWTATRGKPPPVALIVLATLRSGGTWDFAARMAKVHQATIREWNTRGAAILADLDPETTTLDPDTPDETAAYLAFHLEAEAARIGSVVAALSTIDRASRAGNLTAAEMILKRHPEAKPYRPDPRLELSGPDGDAIPVEVRVAGLVAAARAFHTDDAPAEDGDEPEVELPSDAAG